jgi:hypothetical protein
MEKPAMSNLPTQASSKLGALIDTANDAHTSANATLVRIGQLEEALFVVPNSERADEFKTELARLTQRRTTQNNRYFATTATVTAIQAWLTKLPASAALELVEPPPFALKDGEAVIAAVDRLRTELETTQRELAKVRGAGLPVEVMKEQATQFVEELVARGRPVIKGGHDMPFDVRAASHGWSAKSELALLAWLDPKQLIARLHDEIDPSAAAARDDQLRLTSAERDKLIDAMIAVIDDLERQEEDLITRAAEAGGQDIPRRHDASPAAILGVRVVKRSKAEAA